MTVVLGMHAVRQLMGQNDLLVRISVGSPCSSVSSSTKALPFGCGGAAVGILRPSCKCFMEISLNKKNHQVVATKTGKCNCQCYSVFHFFSCVTLINMGQSHQKMSINEQGYIQLIIMQSFKYLAQKMQSENPPATLRFVQRLGRKSTIIYMLKFYFAIALCAGSCPYMYMTIK